MIGVDEVWRRSEVRGGISGLLPIMLGEADDGERGPHGETGSPVKPGGWRNDKRATDIERYRGWRRGKSSEDQNPRGGCGVKQSHEVRVGVNRREGEKP
jgi:hypothetical protein